MTGKAAHQKGINLEKTTTLRDHLRIKYTLHNTDNTVNVTTAQEVHYSVIMSCVYM